MMASNCRFSDVRRRTTASTELKVGLAASAGAGRSPRATARISRSRESRFWILCCFMSSFPFFLNLDDRLRDAAACQNPADFPKEILKQGIGVLELVRPA